jgi:hypothetical protein
MKDWIKATNCALGLRLVVEEDPEQLARVRHRLTPAQDPPSSRRRRNSAGALRTNGDVVFPTLAGCKQFLL